MRFFSALTALAFVALLGSCDSRDLPTPPNLQPVLDAYANPTAAVDGEIMGEVADEIAEAAEEIEGSEIFAEILDLIIEVQKELEDSSAMTCSGGDNIGGECSDDTQCPNGACVTDLVLGATCSGGTNEGGECAADADCPDDGTCGGGVILPSPTGAVQINYICPGWDERQFDDGYDAEPDSAKDGSIDLFMTLDGSGIGRVVWGTASNCLYLVPIEGGNCEAQGCAEASYDGGVALDLGDAVPPGEDISRLPVTFVMEGNIGLDGDDFRINQSFRVILAVESGLEILVDIGDQALAETFNYFFLPGSSQGIRDADGVFGCSLEESQCFELTCEGGVNDGSACTIVADCPEGTCVRRTLFSW